ERLAQHRAHRVHPRDILGEAVDLDPAPGQREHLVATPAHTGDHCVQGLGVGARVVSHRYPHGIPCTGDPARRFAAGFPIPADRAIPCLAMAKRFRAAIIGGSGYGGAEMARRLLLHPDVELVRVASIDHVGEPLGAVHPNLDGATDLVFENLAPAEAARGCDVALLALPHKVTAAKVPELIAAGVKIVDMSGDFRLRDAATYEKYYGAKPPHPELLGSFVYGLPELHRTEIKRARHVASPGCFATAMELALLPLARAGLLDHATVHVTGITGSSGSGIAPGAGTHHPSRAGNLKTYKPLEHQHVPEVVQTLGDAGPRGVQLRFVAVSPPPPPALFPTAF